MSRGKVGGVLAVFLGTIIVYQNCSNSSLPQATSRRTENFPIRSLEALAQLSPLERKEICDLPQNYFCTQRFYQPKTEASDSQKNICLTLDGRAACLDVKVLTYNTDAALDQCSDCSESDREPGGRYNYQESFCYNQILKGRTGVEDRFDSSDLQDALGAARNACLSLLLESR